MITAAQQENIRGWIAKHRVSFLEDLKTLIAVPSVRGGPLPGMPFGRGCDEALETFASLCRKEGFTPRIAPGREYLTVETGNGDSSLGLFSHLDVVPADTGWTVTAPFTPLEKDGFLFGRGASDDKSGAVISLYILKMIRELSLPVRSRVTLVAGVNEESGMADMEAFRASEPLPDHSLVLDTAFPLYRGNKSNVTFTAVSRRPLTEILSFGGGDPASGTVLGEASAQLPDRAGLWEQIADRVHDRIEVSRADGVITLRAVGIPTHGALPAGSLNAGYLLADLLADCSALAEEDCRQMAVLSRLLGRYYGEPFGFEHEDEFGKTTCINKRITSDGGILRLYFNIRHGNGQTPSDILDKAKAALGKDGFDFCEVVQRPGYYIPADDPFVTAMLEEYAACTGADQPKSVLNAGGTYARWLDGTAVETGTWRWRRPGPQLPKGHGGVHQPDEYVDEDGVLDALEINARMLLRADALVHAGA